VIAIPDISGFIRYFLRSCSVAIPDYIRYYLENGSMVAISVYIRYYLFRKLVRGITGIIQEVVAIPVYIRYYLGSGSVVTIPVYIRYYLGSGSVVAIPVYIRQNISWQGGTVGKLDMTVGPKQTMGRTIEQV